MLWYNIGLTHIVRIEDFPIMSAEYIGFLLKPFGEAHAGAQRLPCLVCCLPAACSKPVAAVLSSFSCPFNGSLLHQGVLGHLPGLGELDAVLTPSLPAGWGGPQVRPSSPPPPPPNPTGMRHRPWISLCTLP